MMDFANWILIVTTWLTLGEGLNCMYPRLEDDYDSEGLICQWEENDFYYNEETDKWILNKEDEDDNYFEAKSRKRYWKK